MTVVVVGVGGFHGWQDEVAVWWDYFFVSCFYDFYILLLWNSLEIAAECVLILVTGYVVYERLFLPLLFNKNLSFSQQLMILSQ